MKLSPILVKTLVLFLFLSVGYYFINRIEDQKLKDISFHYTNLVKNKLAYVNLVRLDSKKPSFNTEKSNLIKIIQDTNKTGLEKPLNDSEKDIFTRQNRILEKVFATKSYEEGVKILKSPEGVSLLTDQTKLIEELTLKLR